MIGKKIIRTKSRVYREASPKNADTTERLHVHTSSFIYIALICALLKAMTEHTDASVDLSALSLTHSPTPLSFSMYESIKGNTFPP